MVLRFICSDSLVLYHCKKCKLSSNEKIRHLFHNCGSINKNEVKSPKDLTLDSSYTYYTELSRLSYQLKPNQNKKLKIVTKLCKRFLCDKCASSYTSKRQLNEHSNAKHASEDKAIWYKCEKCNWKSKYQTRLKVHLKNKHFTERKKYQCIECDYQTHQGFRLKNHKILKHTPDHLINWYKCNICLHRLKQKQSLIKHMKAVHTPEDKIIWFKCDLCEYKTKKRFNLKNHLGRKHLTKKHSENQNGLMCQICYADFNQPGNLKHHILSRHSTNTDCFKCEFKGDDYISLRKHLKDKHARAKKIFECDYCFFDTNYKNNLNRHLSKRHT